MIPPYMPSVVGQNVTIKYVVIITYFQGFSAWKHKLSLEAFEECLGFGVFGDMVACSLS